MAWSNEETFKFIDLYQSEPAIWDPNNALHKDKNKVCLYYFYFDRNYVYPYLTTYLLIL